MKRLFACLALFLLGALSVILLEKIFYKESQPTVIQKIIDRSLDKYSIENLSKTPVASVKIEREEILKEDPLFTSHLISFQFDPTLSGKQTKKVTGLLNIPTKPGKFPVIVMARGYVDREIYTTGEGTRRSAEVYAKNGFITFSPDFLGYGGSDSESTSILEARFQTYTTFLTALKSVKNIPEWDGENIFLWGHSNGGQIVLTTLEVTGGNYPTVLWAPVSKPFPYSILYYTDELLDYGKYIRGELANFEDTYDVNLYSIHNYFDRIHAPIELHQGTADEAIPTKWSDELVKTLKEKEVEIKYYKYPGSDHNMRPAWDSIVAKNIQFYKEYIIEE